MSQKGFVVDAPQRHRTMRVALGEFVLIAVRVDQRDRTRDLVGPVVADLYDHLAHGSYSRLQCNAWPDLDHPEVHEIVPSHHCVVRFRQRRPVRERGADVVAEALVVALQDADVSRWPPGVGDQRPPHRAVGGERLAGVPARARRHAGPLGGNNMPVHVTYPQGGQTPLRVGACANRYTRPCECGGRCRAGRGPLHSHGPAQGKPRMARLHAAPSRDRDRLPRRRRAAWWSCARPTRSCRTCRRTCGWSRTPPRDAGRSRASPPASRPWRMRPRWPTCRPPTSRCSTPPSSALC